MIDGEEINLIREKSTLYKFSVQNNSTGQEHTTYLFFITNLFIPLVQNLFYFNLKASLYNIFLINQDRAGELDKVIYILNIFNNIL